jgi:hypothetical protein
MQVSAQAYWPPQSFHNTMPADAGMDGMDLLPSTGTEIPASMFAPITDFELFQYEQSLLSMSSAMSAVSAQNHNLFQPPYGHSSYTPPPDLPYLPASHLTPHITGFESLQAQQLPTLPTTRHSCS